MNLLNNIAIKLENYNLINHSVYNDLSNGTLNVIVLRKYAKQYYYHIAAFPRYISLLHSQCEDHSIRQILLANLMAVEQGEDNSPALWLKFADSLLIGRNELHSEELLKKTQLLINGYFELCQESFATGLGALYAYEQQVPSVMDLIIKGLKNFYGSSNKKQDLYDFDIYYKSMKTYSRECAILIEQLEPKYQKLVGDGAVFGAKLLWQFLDGIKEYNLLLN